MKGSRENYRLEDRVLFEAAAVNQAAEGLAAENANAEEVIAEAQQTGNNTDSSVITEEDLASVALPPQTGDDIFSQDDIFNIDNTVNVPADQQEKILVVINSSVADADKIVNDLGENYEILYLQPGTDALGAINDYLDNRTDTEYTALHIVSHGNNGYFTLNGEKISNDTLNSAGWKAIGEHLTGNADILFYGCNIAADDNGKALIRNIASLTGADVAASTDTTGANGDWDLEYQTGFIETAAISAPDYQYSFIPDVKSLEVTTTKDVTDAEDGLISLREAIAYAAEGITADDGTYTITFSTAEGYFTGADNSTITLSKPLTLKNSITIDGDVSGDGKADVTISGGGTTQIFSSISTGNGQTYQFFDIIFDKAKSGTGGAVMQFEANKSTSANVNVTLDGVTISNSVSESGYGGAISSRPSSTTGVYNASYVFRNSIFFNNTGGSDGAVMNIGRGGTMYASARNGSVLIEKCLFDSNQSTSTGGGIVYLHCVNGATVTDSTFINNAVTDSKDGGIIYAKYTRLLAVNSTFAENETTYGIITGGDSAYIHVVSSVFCNNDVTQAEGTVGGILAGIESKKGKNTRLFTVNSVFLDNTVSNNNIMCNNSASNSRRAYHVLYNDATLNNQNSTEESNLKLSGDMQDYYIDSVLRMVNGGSFTMWDGSAETAAAHLASITDPRMFFTPVEGSDITTKGTQTAVNRSGVSDWTTYFKVGNDWKSLTIGNTLNSAGADLPDAAEDLLIANGIDGTSNSFESSKTTYYAAGNYQSVLWAITLNSNNGTGKTEFLAKGKKDAAIQTDAAAVNTFVYDGWTFAGFDTSTTVTAAGDIDFAGSNDTVILTVSQLDELRASGATLYAVWEKNIKVSYAAADGIAVPGTEIYTVYNGASEFTMTPPADYSNAPDGWTFAGWSKKSYTAEAGVTAEQTFAVTDAMTLYAVYSRTVSLAYYANEGTGTVPAGESKTQYRNYNAAKYSAVSFTVAENTFTKTDYVFKGWNTSAAGDGENYAAGSTYTVSDNSIPALYAVWIPELHVTIGADGETSKSYDGKTVTLKADATGGENGSYVYTWYKDGTLLDGMTESSITVKDAADSAVYRVVVFEGTQTAEDTQDISIAQTAANLSVTVSTGIIYDGSAIEVGTDIAAAVSGINDGDTPTGTISYKFYADDQYTDEIAITPADAGTYYAEVVLAADGNYAGATVKTVFTIGKAVLMVSGITAVDKIYDGSNTATLNDSGAWIVNGKIGSDDVTVSGTGVFTNVNAGEGRNVELSLSLSGADAGNYQVSEVSEQVTANISKAMLTVTADAQTKVYGSADPELTYKVEGLVGNDMLTGNLVRAPGGDVGTYAITQGTLENSNYQISFTGADFTIVVRVIVKSTESQDPVIFYEKVLAMTNMSKRTDNVFAMNYSELVSLEHKSVINKQFESSYNPEENHSPSSLFNHDATFMTLDNVIHELSSSWSISGTVKAAKGMALGLELFANDSYSIAGFSGDLPGIRSGSRKVILLSAIEQNLQEAFYSRNLITAKHDISADGYMENIDLPYTDDVFEKISRVKFSRIDFGILDRKISQFEDGLDKAIRKLVAG